MRCGAQEFDADIYVNDKDKLELGELKMTFLHTPGHTQGCMCIRVEDEMFTGDTYLLEVLVELIYIVGILTKWKIT